MWQSYKIVIAIEKRQVGAFMTNAWRMFFREQFPNIQVVELILVHQITQIISFPILWITFMSRLVPGAAKDTVIRLGPCRHLMKDIKLQNPYVPNIYLVDPTGNACWMSSSSPTEEDQKQLNEIFTVGTTKKSSKKQPFKKKKRPTK